MFSFLILTLVVTACAYLNVHTEHSGIRMGVDIQGVGVPVYVIIAFFSSTKLCDNVPNSYTASTTNICYPDPAVIGSYLFNSMTQTKTTITITTMHYSNSLCTLATLTKTDTAKTSSLLCTVGASNTSSLVVLQSNLTTTVPGFQNTV